MNIIKKLSLHEAQKIAAGEVIDRPAHCIKELVENSLDATATAITVECGQAGKEYIIVTDNGLGMSYDNLVLAYQRHTTSKIDTCDDLQRLTTFGFRGEALASMCAVAQVIFTTKTDQDAHATELTVENQAIMSERPAARTTGTTIHINGLFNGLPARKKFLKKDVTEWNHCLIVLKAFIAQHLNVHFLIKHDNYLVYNCPPVNSYKDRIHQLYGSVVENHLQEIVKYHEKGIVIQGAITDSVYGRFDKSGIYIFVNKRLVKNYHLVKAVLQGYENSLQPGRFPVAIVSITVDPSVIDVNVHPKKEEILFQFPHQIDKAIATAIKQTLVERQKKLQPPHPTMPLLYDRPMEEKKFFPAHMIKKSYDYQATFDNKIEAFDIQEALKVSPSLVSYDSASTAHRFSEQPFHEQRVIMPREYVVVGIYKKTYIMVEDENGLLIVDQHALHERMLYDNWTLKGDSFDTIPLLFPITFSLIAEEFQLLQPYLQLLQQFGIVFEQMGPSLFRITSVPVFLKQEPIELIIREVLTWIYEEKEIDSTILYTKLTHKLRTLIACKSAIKAGDTIAEQMITTLLNHFYTSDNCLTCPHGRPISWRLSLSELEKKFKRDYRS